MDAEPIDLILATDAISRPLTGIGRYAFELAKGLPSHSHVGKVRYFSFGRWVDRASIDEVASLESKSQKTTMRSALASTRVAVRVFHALMPKLSRWRLRNESRALFHSPNYFLPPAPGIKIATVHDLSHVLFPQFHPVARVVYMNRAFPDTLRLADHLITDAESVRQELIDHFGWPAERVSAVPLGVDAVFHPRTSDDLQFLLPKYDLIPGQYALYVGTIEPRKNIDRLLTAYEVLPQSLRKHFPLVLVGAKGWHSGGIHDRITKAASEGWLHYLAYVPQADLPLIYAGARVFAYPSLYEGFGLPALEAMASGIPVITSNTSSMPEVVGDAAWLIDPLDIQSISDALDQVLQNDGWRLQASERGLARARQFAWSDCVNNTVSVYQSVSHRIL